MDHRSLEQLDKINPAKPLLDTIQEPVAGSVPPSPACRPRDAGTGAPAPHSEYTSGHQPLPIPEWLNHPQWTSVRLIADCEIAIETPGGTRYFPNPFMSQDALVHWLKSILPSETLSGPSVWPTVYVTAMLPPVVSKPVVRFYPIRTPRTLRQCFDPSDSGSRQFQWLIDQLAASVQLWVCGPGGGDFIQAFAVELPLDRIGVNWLLGQHIGAAQWITIASGSSDATGIIHPDWILASPTQSSAAIDFCQQYGGSLIVHSPYAALAALQQHHTVDSRLPAYGIEVSQKTMVTHIGRLG